MIVDIYVFALEIGVINIVTYLFVCVEALN